MNQNEIRRIIEKIKERYQGEKSDEKRRGIKLLARKFVSRYGIKFRDIIMEDKYFVDNILDGELLYGDPIKIKISKGCC